MDAQGPVYRTTMFTVPNRDHTTALVQAYQRLASQAKKARSPILSMLISGSILQIISLPKTLTRCSQDGKPYILSSACGPAADEPRANGYNFVARTTFASKEDMDFYDNQCPAHKDLKISIKDKVAGPPMVIWFQDALNT